MAILRVLKIAQPAFFRNDTSIGLVLIQNHEVLDTKFGEKFLKKLVANGQLGSIPR